MNTTGHSILNNNTDPANWGINKIGKMSKEKRNFKIKMNLACGNDDLRPIMQHVYFDNGFMIATDAHALIKAAVLHHSDFDQEEVNILNGKFIHKNTFKKLLSIKMLKITDEGIVDLATKDVYKFTEVDGKYVNYEAVIPKGSGKIKEIGITPQVASKLLKVLASTDIYTLRMCFEAPNRAIVFKGVGEHEGTLTAMVMPAMIHE